MEVLSIYDIVRHVHHLFTLTRCLILKFILCRTFSKVSTLIPSIARLILSFIWDMDVIFSENTKYFTYHHRMKSRGSNEVTSESMGLILYCQSSAEEVVFSSNFSQDVNIAERHHPAEKLDKGAGSLTLALHDCEASFYRFHQLQLVQNKKNVMSWFCAFHTIL